MTTSTAAAADVVTEDADGHATLTLRIDGKLTTVKLPPGHRRPTRVPTARVTDDGMVWLTYSYYVRVGPNRSLHLVVPDSDCSRPIGRVSINSPTAWTDADHLIRVAGWRRSAPWTTSGRRPVCLISQPPRG